MVLGADEVGAGEEGVHPGEGVPVVPYVVVGDDHVLGAGQAQAGDDAVDLAVGEAEVGRGAYVLGEGRQAAACRSNSGWAEPSTTTTRTCRRRDLVGGQLLEAESSAQRSST